MAGGNNRRSQITQISNQFRWSKSRVSAFSDCRRKYYLRYYRHWGGWEAGADDLARLAYRLGKMTSMAVLVGSSVHEVLARHFRAVRNGIVREPDPEGPVRLMRTAWTNARKELWRGSPKRYPPIFEIYYDRVPSPERLKEYAEKAREAIRTIRGLPIYGLVRGLDPADILWVDPVGEGFSEEIIFEVPPYRAISAPDLVIREKGRVVIVDWKTGKESEADRVQMAAAAVWAEEKLGDGGEEIEGALVYTESGATRKIGLDREERERVKKIIRDDMAAMAACLRDPEKNIPRGEECFPRRDNPGFCRYCEFQEICLGNREEGMGNGGTVNN